MFNCGDSLHQAGQLTKTTVKYFTCPFSKLSPSPRLCSCVSSCGRPTARSAHSAPISGEMTSQTQPCPRILPWTSPQRRPQPRMCLLGAFTSACWSYGGWHRICWMATSLRYCWMCWMRAFIQRYLNGWYLKFPIIFLEERCNLVLITEKVRTRHAPRCFYEKNKEIVYKLHISSSWLP